MQSMKVMIGPTRIEKLSQFIQSRWTSTKVMPIEKAWAGYISAVLQLGKGSREAARIGPTVLHTRFFSLSNISK